MPEEVDRARLAVEPAAELLEDAVRPVENAVVSPHRFEVPRSVLHVLREGRVDRKSERLLPDLDVDAEPPEGGMQEGVEVGDARAELEAARATVGGADDERVVDEVERDVIGRLLLMETARGQAAHVDVERDVPPVVARRSRGEPDLADDLAVEVERVLRRAPVGEVELGKLLLGHGPDLVSPS